MNGNEDLYKRITLWNPLGIASALFVLTSFMSRAAREGTNGLLETVLIVGSLAVTLLVFSLVQSLAKDILRYMERPEE